MKIESKIALNSAAYQLVILIPVLALMAAFQIGMNDRVKAAERTLSELTKVSRAYQASVSECAKERKEWECRAMLGGSAIFMIPSVNLTELK